MRARTDSALDARAFRAPRRSSASCSTHGALPVFARRHPLVLLLTLHLVQQVLLSFYSALATWRASVAGLRRSWRLVSGRGRLELALGRLEDAVELGREHDVALDLELAGHERLLGVELAVRERDKGVCC